jgi:hypothetical protein
MQPALNTPTRWSTFRPLISFEDLDIPGDYDRFNKMAAEYYQGFGDYYANFPTPYVFGLSWSDEIESERRTGSYHGSTLFIADETITVNLPLSVIGQQ